MTPQLPPTWQRLFTQPAPPLVPPASVPARALLGSTPTGRPAARDGGATSAAPPPPPRPPVETRPTPPEPPRRALELAWLACHLPEPMREAVMFNLRQTLGWRARQCKPLKPPKTPHIYTRFGLLGEQLQPKGVITVSKTLRAELREMIRVVEGAQSRTERNRLLAMHGIRLGQLCAELEQRGIDALEKLRWELTSLWN